MDLDVNGASVEINANGYLESMEDWNEDVAEALAKQEGIELTEKHWDVIKFLRQEFADNNGSQPNDRKIIKAMTSKWDTKVSQKDLYELFPGKPDKQAGQIGGLPETRRKGGY